MRDVSIRGLASLRGRRRGRAARGGDVSGGAARRGNERTHLRELLRLNDGH